MSPTPLHQLAEEGRDSLAKRAADAGASGAAIRDRVREGGRLSVNMKPSVLLAFLETGRHRNVFESVAHESAKTGRSRDELLQARLGRFCEARIDFERRLGGDHHFYYGALNLGGMGARRFGRYCVIDRRRAVQTRPDPVWLVEDSLSGRRFRDAHGALQLDRLAEWIAPCDMAGELTGIKLFETRADDPLLPERICNELDYIEAVSLRPLQREEVEEIRSEVDDSLQDRALDALLKGAPLPEQVDLFLHERVRALAAEHEIPWRQLVP